jgi:PAS domain S-box-containing protein
MLVDHAPDGIFIANAHSRYQEVNVAECEMLGYSREEILGMSVTDVLPLTALHGWQARWLACEAEAQ